MRLNKNRIFLKKITEQDDCFMEGSQKDRISFIWELTAELWSLQGKEYVERRLQRNVTKLIRVPLSKK